MAVDFPHPDDMKVEKLICSMYLPIQSFQSARLRLALTCSILTTSGGEGHPSLIQVDQREHWVLLVGGRYV